MNDTRIPETVEALHGRYDKLIRWAVMRQLGALRVSPSHDLVDDLVQQIYIYILKSTWFARAQRYYATGDGAFSTALTRMTRQHVARLYRRQTLLGQLRLLEDRTGSGPVNETSEWGSSYEVSPDPFENLPCQAPLPSSSVMAADFLDALGRRFTRRVGKWPPREARIVKVLEVARDLATLDSGEIARATGINPITIRSYIVSIRREAQKLETVCPTLPGSMKSAPPTSVEISARSGPRLVASRRVTAPSSSSTSPVG